MHNWNFIKQAALFYKTIILSFLVFNLHSAYFIFVCSMVPDTLDVICCSPFIFDEQVFDFWIDGLSSNSVKTYISGVHCFTQIYIPISRKATFLFHSSHFLFSIL